MFYIYCKDRKMNFFKNLFDTSPRIETERLILRRIRVSDARDMYEYARRPEVTRYLLWAPHESLEYTRTYLKQAEREYRAGSFHDFGVIYKENNKLIGTCGFARIDRANSTAEAGYVLNPDYWGMGIAPEALRAVIRMGFEKQGFNRIEARYMADNIRSRRVMEKCGMRCEGIHRQSLFVRDSFADVGICALLKDDYIPDPESYQKFTNI